MDQAQSANICPRHTESISPLECADPGEQCILSRMCVWAAGIVLSVCCSLPQCCPWHLYISADDTAGNCYQTSQMPACLSLAGAGRARPLSWNCFTWGAIRAAAEDIARRAAPRQTPLQHISVFSTACICSCSQWFLKCVCSRQI